jgi:hypothetical protein
MPKLFHCLPLLVSSLASLLSGCLDPSLEVAGGSVFPEQPPPDRPYQCGSSSGKPCAEPRARVWVPGWYVLESAARGDKVAFVAYPCFPNGGANTGEPKYLGQVSVDKGTLDWVVPIGKNQGDVYNVYDLTLAPSGDIIVGASGYGELLLGNKVGQFDGFIASFDSSGKKRFAQRLDNSDGELPPYERPQLINLKIIVNENIFVHTGWQVTPLNQQTKVPLFLYAFAPNGTRILRQEVPFSQATHGGHMWAVPDGTMWSKAFPGPFRRYSQKGEILDTFELQPSAEIRGFAAMSPKTMLINLTAKGMTNEMYRFDFGAPMTPLFSENTFPEIHAAEINQSIGFAHTYMVSLGYSATAHRIQSIDVDGKRGPATTVTNVHTRFTILDSEEAVLVRLTDFGTEFIVQPL